MTSAFSFCYDIVRVSNTGGILVPLSELAAAERVVGEKEVRRALAKGLLCKIFVAIDADSGRGEALLADAEAAGVEVEQVESRLILGRACAIDRSAAAAGLLKR